MPSTTKKPNDALTLESFENFVREWGQNSPIDVWWRGKYQIPFGSQAHRQVTTLDQVFAYIEINQNQKVDQKNDDAQDGEDFDLESVTFNPDTGEYTATAKS